MTDWIIFAAVMAAMGAAVWALMRLIKRGPA